MSETEDNPAICQWNGLGGLPRFYRVRDEDFVDGFDAAFAEHDAEIEVIAGNDEEAGFGNTIVALEVAGDALSRVSALFWNKAGAHSNDLIQSMEHEIAPKMTRQYSRIGMNAALFRRIDAIWAKQAEQGRTEKR